MSIDHGTGIYDIKGLKHKHIIHGNTHFESLVPMRFEGNEYHDYFRRIPFQELIKLLNDYNIDLNDKKILIAGCGSGIDVYYLKKFIKAEYNICDISENAVKTVLATFNGVSGSIQDIEQLSYQNDTFDWSFIAASLHHLPRPILGLYELLRVSKYGLIFIEPNDSWLTRLFIKLGLAQKIEPCGNYVYRFDKRGIEKICGSIFCDFGVRRFFAIHKIANSPLFFLILKTINYIANKAVPSWGNYIICVIKKECYKNTMNE